MNRFSLASFALLSSGLAVAQQSPLRDVQDLAADYALVQRLDGALWGLGRAYSTRFDANGPVFHPANKTSHELVSVALFTTALGRGQSLLPVPPPEAPVEQGRTVRYVRGPWTEQYDVRPDGMKQSFVFDAIPDGDGDLVVAMQVKTQLPLRAADASTVTFGDEQLEVRIAGVVGIDGQGRRTTGSLAYGNGTLSLRLPHAFVQHATLPLVLDPLISSTTLTPAGTSLVDSIHAAYDASTDKYLVVWCTGYGQMNLGEVRGCFVPGGPVLLAAIDDNRDVWVADNNLRDCFVVSWTLGAPLTFPFSGTQFGCQLRTARSPSQLGPVLSFFDLPPVDNRAMQVASNRSTSPTGADLAAVYVHADGAEMRGVRVNADYSLTLSNTRTTLATTLVDKVGISRYGDDTNRYLTALGQRGPGANGNIVLQEYALGGTPLTTALSLSAGANVTSVEIGSLELEATHGFTRWTVLWSALGGFAYVPYVTRLHRVGTNLQSEAPAGLPTTAGIGGRPSHFALASTDRSTAVVYPSRGIWHLCQSTPCHESSVLNLTNHGTCRPCRGQVMEPNEMSPAFVRPAAEGATYPGAADDIRLFWASGNSDLRMATYVFEDGTVTQLAPACGGLTATSRQTCAFVGGAVYQSVLEGSPTNNNFLVLGTQRLDTTCGACTLVPDPFTGVVLGAPPRNAVGDTWIDLTIPNVSALVGLALYQQWVVLDGGSPGCAVLGADFSAAHRIGIQ